LLYALRDGGFELVEAGYMDLLGQAWGCTVQGGQGESLVIALRPAVAGAARCSSNPLQATIIRIGMADWMRDE
jgi:hypothetical protein